MKLLLDAHRIARTTTFSLAGSCDHGSNWAGARDFRRCIGFDALTPAPTQAPPVAKRE